MRINSATERSFSSKLAAELLAASKRSGKAFARAQEINKLVEKNIDYLKRRERRERSEGTSQFQKK